MLKERFDTPIPDGYRIFENEFELAGTHHYKAEIAKTFKKGNAIFRLKKEPKNKYDKNAIVLKGVKKGFFGEKELTVGYIPKDVAAQIAEANTFDSMTLRIKAIYISDSEYVEIKVDLLGQKSDYDKYMDAEE